MRGGLCALAALALTGATALAQGVWNVTLPANGHYLYGFAVINPDCSLEGYPTVRMTTPPANGVVRISRGGAFPRFERDNPRSACNTRRVPGTLVEYRPRRGFVGADSFVLDVIMPRGLEKVGVFNLMVK